VIRTNQITIHFKTAENGVRLSQGYDVSKRSIPPGIIFLSFLIRKEKLSRRSSY